MNILCIVLQLVAGLTILNVWLLRREKPTPYRGKDARNMKEEFAAYGLGGTMFYIVGFLKILSALGLLIGIFVPALVLPSAVLLGILMIGALVMHIKVSDPMKKALPALTLLGICIVIALCGDHLAWV